MINRLYVG